MLKHSFGAHWGRLMRGQWIGGYDGTNRGNIIVDIDDVEAHYEIAATLQDGNPALPHSIVELLTPNKEHDLNISRQSVRVFDPRTGSQTAFSNVSDLYKGVNFPETADVNLKYMPPNLLDISWTTDLGGNGFSRLRPSGASNPSEYAPLRMEWPRFKEYVSDLSYKRYIFRGQGGDWRLRTHFHRTGRANLWRFMREDVPSLRRQLSSRLRHLYNLDNPEEYLAFLSLVQHHGYPTPLLDWSFSPYVAVFFAYRGIPYDKFITAGDDEAVRIFVFDQTAWTQRYRQVGLLSPVGRNFTVREPLAIDNERMIPQQAVSTVTNVDDIESYIRECERDSKMQFLNVISLRLADGPKIMRELSLMGITAGSLIPGLDGACEELKARFFGPRAATV